MTYYGRWTYKYEIAAKKGAAAAILVHENGPAGYPFAVVQGSWSRENFDIATAAATGAGACRSPSRAGSTRRRPKQLCQAAGQDLAALKAAAVRRDFQPVAAGRHGPVRDRGQVAPGPVAQRGRPARRLRPGPPGPVRHLHGALGPPGQRSQRSRATRSTTARPTTPRASPRCSRSPGRSRRSSRPRSDRSSSWP